MTKIQSHPPVGGKPKCQYPNCPRGAASRGMRGKNSTVDPNGRRYWKWCTPHRKGDLKKERIDYVNSQTSS